MAFLKTFALICSYSREFKQHPARKFYPRGRTQHNINFNKLQTSHHINNKAGNFQTVKSKSIKDILTNKQTAVQNIYLSHRTMKTVSSAMVSYFPLSDGVIN